MVFTAICHFSVMVHTSPQLSADGRATLLCLFYYIQPLSSTMACQHVLLCNRVNLNVLL